MVPVDVCASIRYNIDNIREVPSVNQNVVDLGLLITPRVSPGVAMAVCMLEKGGADAHVLGRGKVYQPESVVICQLVDAEASNRWFICLLLSDLSIKVFDDNLHVMLWAAVVLPLQLRIEGILLVIGAPKVRTMTLIMLRLKNLPRILHLHIRSLTGHHPITFC